MYNEVDISPEVAVAHSSLLGEGPVWYSAEHCLLWLDILQKTIHIYYPYINVHESFPVATMPGAIAPRKGGGLIAALQDGFALVNIKYKTVVPVINPESHIIGNRFNDGKCDPAGRFWAGTMALSEEPGSGSLYVLGPDFKVTKKVGGVTISNGLAWSHDHTKFYYIDTPTLEVVAYDYNIETGDIHNKKTIINIDPADGYPDGMTIDKEGMLWIAHWDGWQVTRWDPAYGEKLMSIKIPVARVTSCTFGGDELGDLYITTASTGLTDEQLKEQPLAGSLLVIKNCGYYGTAPYEFND